MFVNIEEYFSTLRKVTSMRFVYIISFNILKKKLILKFQRERSFLIFQFIYLFEIYQRILHKTHGIRNILKQILETRLKNVDNN